MAPSDAQPHRPHIPSIDDGGRAISADNLPATLRIHLNAVLSKDVTQLNPS